jgi:multiple sugar transport system ATP-binding protein
MARVLLKGLRKEFDKGTVAVEGLDLEIKDKEFVVLLGPSGCGKTTTLRCIAGLEFATGGEVQIGDRVVNDLEPKDRNIAMVFQSYALYPHLTVYQNMAFPLENARMPEREIVARVNRAARLLEITNLLDRKPIQLSGGQRQRVALGRAIVREPDVFLMDEPLSNLDAKLRLHMRAELKKLQKDLGITTVYVTHDQVEAMTMGQRIAILHKGVLQQYDTPRSVYAHPANNFVAGFVGSPPINCFNCTLTGDGVLDAGDFQITLPERFQTLLADGTGRDLVVGIRPQDVEVFREDAPERDAIGASLYTTEPQGDATILDLIVGGQLVKAVVSANMGVDGIERFVVRFPADRLHLFDAKTGESIG